MKRRLFVHLVGAVPGIALVQRPLMAAPHAKTIAVRARSDRSWLPAEPGGCAGSQMSGFPFSLRQMRGF